MVPIPGLARRYRHGYAPILVGVVSPPVRRVAVKPVMLIPVLGIGWVAFCLFDLVRAKQVRYLPKWGWAILCCGIGLTIPFGGILYLWVGRERRPQPPRADESLAIPRLLWPGSTPHGTPEAPSVSPTTESAQVFACNTTHTRWL